MLMYKKCICPVTIDCQEKDSIEILSNVDWSEMTIEAKMAYFNITEDKYGINNLYVTSNEPVQPNIKDYLFRLACNHNLAILAAIYKESLILMQYYQSLT